MSYMMMDIPVEAAQSPGGRNMEAFQVSQLRTWRSSLANGKCQPAKLGEILLPYFENSLSRQVRVEMPSS